MNYIEDCTEYLSIFKYLNMQYKDKRGNTRRSSGRNFEVDDFEEQKVKIRELFDQYEKENSPLPSGLIGITYAQYRDCKSY